MKTNKRHAPHRLLLACALLTSALIAGCAGDGDSGRGQRHDLKGTIVSFDRGHQQVIIAHEDVPGLMEAMTMPFTLREDSAYEVMRAGDRIQATLVVDGDRSWLENPVITQAPQPTGAAAPDGGSAREPQPGEEVPDFALTDQDGKRITLRSYRGRALALTFIYTRCPLPEYCTLMSTNFNAVARELRNEPALAERARLLSVSIDPAHDTPKVLRSYGAAHTGNYSAEKFDLWAFATGSPEEVRRVANFFGLTYDRGAGEEILHSLSTAIVAPDGRLYKIYRGNEWKPEEILRDIRELSAKG